MQNFFFYVKIYLVKTFKKEVMIMYYPKQIPHLLDREFKKYINYQEYHFKELEDYYMCIWEMKSKDTFSKSINNNILPDACIDIVIDFTHKNISFAGFSSETEILKLDEEIDFLGVRMKPGTFYTIFNITADKIMDTPQSFAKIEEYFDLTPIFHKFSSEERIEYFKDYLLKKIFLKPNTDFIQLVEEIYENPQDKKVLLIANKLGCNQKQLFRLFKKHYGVSPKVLLNILRLQRCLTLMIEEEISLIDIAQECGFYDQSHFIKEIKRYTNISPLKFLENVNK